mgnify:CR=1 FL=1
MPIIKKAPGFKESQILQHKKHNTTLTLPPSISRQILQFLNPGLEFDINEEQEDHRQICQVCKSPLFHASYYRNKQWADILECRNCKTEGEEIC